MSKECKCNDCKYADKERMKCNPQSKDCSKEYELDTTDFVELKYCDFYKRKNEEY